MIPLLLVAQQRRLQSDRFRDQNDTTASELGHNKFELRVPRHRHYLRNYCCPSMKAESINTQSMHHPIRHQASVVVKAVSLPNYGAHLKLQYLALCRRRLLVYKPTLGFYLCALERCRCWGQLTLSPLAHPFGHVFAISHACSPGWSVVPRNRMHTVLPLSCAELNQAKCGSAEDNDYRPSTAI